jgi:hypothetical protein
VRVFKVKHFVTSVEDLIWAKSHGCPFTERTCAIAAQYGGVEVLQWLHVEQGCPWDAATSCNLAMFSNIPIEALTWAREQGCPWNASLCTNCAYSGRLEVLKWAREQGCPWDSVTCTISAMKGHLHVLQWARNNGAPWNTNVCDFAVSGSRRDMLSWARENGAPWTEQIRDDAAKMGYTDDFPLAPAAV